MGVALPELPDDRRAQPRRHDAGDGGSGPRHSRDVAAGRHAAPSPDGLPGRPWPLDEGYGRRGLPSDPDLGEDPRRNGYRAPADGGRESSANGHGTPLDDPGPGSGGRDGYASAPEPPGRNGVPRYRVDGSTDHAPEPVFDPSVRGGGRGLDEPTGLFPGGLLPSRDRNGDGGRGHPPARTGGHPGQAPAPNVSRGRARPGPRPIPAEEIDGPGPRSFADPSGPPRRPVDDGRQSRYRDGNPLRPDDAPRNGHPGPRSVEGANALPPTGPADDDTISLPLVPPVPPPARAPDSDVPTPRRQGTGPVGRAAFRQKPVQRPAADEDPPTVALLGEPPDDGPDDDAVPGRHRRRAGESADGRPGVDYRAEAAAAGHPTRGGRRRRPAFWKELPILVVVALLLTFLIQTFVAKVYVIPSGSMETTLHGCTGCTNDRVLVDKVTYRFSDPRPGDVVVFRGPDGWTSEFTADPPSNVVVAALQQLGSLVGLAPPDEKDFIKRVIAVGGQTVQCCDPRNRVLVDGKPLTEPYIYYLPEAGPPRQDSFGPVKVPQGSLWMMGDSRNNSADSRVAGHGPVPVSDVIGKARVIVLPFARFGSIPDTNPQATPVGMGGDAGAPLALGLVGVLPLMALRRRRGRHEFLPGD